MAKTLVRTTFILFILLLLRGPLFGQLREIYLDSDSSNTINRVSFFSASEGYVAFTKWIGHTTDSGRTYTQLFITNSNVNYNGYSVNLTFGFEIAGPDKKFVPAAGKIEGQTILVGNPLIQNPMYVRYSWEPTSKVSIVNGEGLPASPFTTDDSYEFDGSAGFQ